MHDRWRTPSVLMVAMLMLSASSSPASAAEDVARIKVMRGTVTLQRAGQSSPVAVGMALQEHDVVVTGKDGAVGITFQDDSLLSAGPDSTLAIDRFSFNPTTHAGAFETTLRSGTLAVVSGKIAKQSGNAMRVRTPSTILGVRGTEFLVRTSTVTP